MPRRFVPSSRYGTPYASWCCPYQPLGRFNPQLSQCYDQHGNGKVFSISPVYTKPIKSTEKDIIPPHGFLAKPSELWPLDPLPLTPRIAPTITNPPPLPGEADTLKPTAERAEVEEEKHDVPQGNHKVETQEEMLEKYRDSPPSREVGLDSTYSHLVGIANDGPEPGKDGHIPEASGERTMEGAKDDWEPKPAKILMENDTQTPLEIRSQIQLYATSE